MKINKKTENSGGQLGTFSGVFTPSILTILGIILFLRLGYVTGSSGIARAFIIIAIANVITVLTSMSLAAIATNLKVKGGGDYYLISRTLGMEFGGAIGIVLYLAQSVSVAFYCIGFAEALSAIMGPTFFLSSRLIALLAVSAIFVLAWIGADWATRFQYLVMILLGAALFSFFAGGLPQWQEELFLANWTPPADSPPFWVVFGIFFPAVTGFTQGVSMSGDLADPGKSLPAGTFMAVGLSIIIYFAVVVVFAGVLPNRTLMEDYQAIKLVSRYDFLIDAGVIAATLSSAMASFLGGPRILQSLATDKIFPLLAPFAKGSGSGNNPRRAVLLSGAIAVGVIMIGQLNLVARIVTMFFLISYGLLNYATYYEANSDSPSFRPLFKWFNKYLSLAGCLVCLLIIFALDPQYGVIAMAILAAIYQYIKRTAGPSRWADSGRSHAMQVIRSQLLAVENDPQHDRDWRPHILAFTKDAERRLPLLRFSEWIGGGSGIISAVKIVEGEQPKVEKRRGKEEKELQQLIRQEKLNIFPLAVAAPDFTIALPFLLQSYGVGPLKGNTVVTNWYGETMTPFPGLTAMKFGHNLRVAFRLGYNLVVFHLDPLRTCNIFDPDKDERTIDVWWNNDAGSRLMLLLAYLMTRNKLWKNSHIRLLSEKDGENPAIHIEELEQQLDDARISAKVILVDDRNPETILKHSSTSSIVFLPFRIQRSMLTDAAGYSLERVLTQLPPTALVMAAEDIDLDAEPEEGPAGELAEALDRLQEMERRAAGAKKQYSKIEKLIPALEQQLADIADSSDTDRKKIEKELGAAQKEQERLYRKMAREQAKLDDAVSVVKNF
jgi:amino acid transporter